MLQDAPAAWIPSVFELLGGLMVLGLKLFFEHTAVGRRMCAQPMPQQEQQPEQLTELQGIREWSKLDLVGRTGSILSNFGPSSFGSVLGAGFFDEGAGVLISTKPIHAPDELQVHKRHGVLHSTCPGLTAAYKPKSASDMSVGLRVLSSPGRGGGVERPRRDAGQLIWSVHRSDAGSKE